jgi:prevent-host-death family protein
MKRRIGAGEFKAKCLHLIDEVHASRKDIVITKRGRALARLVPAEEDFPQIFGRMAGTFEILGDIVAPTGEHWEADE